MLEMMWLYFHETLLAINYVFINSHHSWVLYEKPDFQGRCIALEEGGIELDNMWAEVDMETEPQNLPPMQIGSIRHAVWVSVLVQHFNHSYHSVTGTSDWMRLDLDSILHFSINLVLTVYEYELSIRMI